MWILPFSRWSWRGAVVTAALLIALPASAQDVKLTPAKEVAANPQRFWARGVVFRDVLTAPPGGSRSTIGERSAFAFSTKIVGSCYADETIAPVIRELPTGKEYIFSATVFSEMKGLIRKRTVYRILVDGVVSPADGLGTIAERAERARAALPDQNPYAMRLDVLRALLGRIQELVTVMVASEQIDRKELFDPDSPHFEKLIMAARRSVNDFEVESNIPGREHLAQILVALAALAENRIAVPGAPVEAPAMPIPVEESVEAADAEVESSVPEPVLAPKEEATLEKAASPQDSEPEPVPKRRVRAREPKESPKPAPSPSLRWHLPVPAKLPQDEPPADASEAPLTPAPDPVDEAEANPDPMDVIETDDQEPDAP